MESLMDTYVLNEKNHKKWNELHNQSAKMKTRLNPNEAIKKIIRFKNNHDTSASNRKVLEVGCGFGRNLYYLMDNHYAESYYGVDLTNKSVDIAKKLLSESFPQTECYIKQADVGEGLDYEGNYFDSVFDIMSAITFIVDEEDRQRYFSEVKRVLKKGGVYYFYCPRKGGIFRDAILDDNLLEKGYIRRELDCMLERVYTKKELVEFLQPLKLIQLEINSKHTRAFGNEIFIRDEGFWFGAFQKV